jgi:macrolide transport system ATP-binding/permease protein
MSAFFRKLHWLVRRRVREAELREEIDFHLGEEAEQRQSEGALPDQARWSAQRDFGNVTLAKENTRAVWTWIFLEQLLQDVRYALRTAAANPTFSALAILTLALGIGANTAIYSVMDSILMRSLPVPGPDSLVMLNWHGKARRPSNGERGPATVMYSGMSTTGSTYNDPKTGFTGAVFPYPAFELFAKNSAVFSNVFGYCLAGNLNLIVKGQADIATGEYVSGDYFRGLAVPPAAGRLIGADDDLAGAPPVVVVSLEFSNKRFGGPANADGQSILINDLPFTVAGVTAPGFFGVDPQAAPDFYLPMHTSLLLKDSIVRPDWYFAEHSYWIEIMARLRPGVSLQQAQEALAPPFHQWVVATATNDRERADLPALLLKPGAGGLDVLRRQYSKPLYVLMTLVVLILAIVCANIANLLLARAAARRREIALRLSLGASRWRVVRQLLTESVALAFLGGVLGTLFAVWGVRFLTLLLANGRTNFPMQAELNWHVLSVAAALSLVTGILFGLVPAIQATRGDTMPALKEGRANRARSHIRVSLSQTLVVAQIAMSLLMLVAAGLFTRTLSNLRSVELGFNRENILLFQVNAGQAGHKEPEIATFYSNLQKRFSAIPGIRSATLSNLPLIGSGNWFSPVYPVGALPPDAATNILAVGPGFFTTMQIPLLAGREIGERDAPGSQPVAIVNELFATANFGLEYPIGRHLTLQNRGTPFDLEIIGLAKDARYGFLKEKAAPVVYVEYRQVSRYGMTYALRVAGEPLGYVNTVRAIVRDADARVPVAKVTTQAAAIDRTMFQEITFAELCSAFAFLALAIACVGLYATVAYSVTRRIGEIGIRMALGAQRRVVVWMILREVIVLTLVGLMVSLPTAIGTSKFVASFLFDMKPNDPAALTAAAATLLCAAIFAGYVPARRASRVDPMTALRHE